MRVRNRIWERIIAAVSLAPLLAASAAVATAGAAEAQPGYSDGDGNSGSSLIGLNPAFGDSLLEVDRTLNFNHGDGSSAGSDNEGGE